MSEKINNELKKPNELDIDLENNNRALNRDIGKIKPVDGFYVDENITSIENETKEDGFDYEKKYSTGKKIDSSQESEISGKNEDNEQNTSGTKLNPRLEQITEPDPNDKKRANDFYTINKRNRNQPL